jgi:hypothetical protein
MTFVFPLMLAGLALVGVPVLVHLIMQQKPKRLPFPAVRFLLQTQRTNQRKLRLRHWLLLALRMALIAAACLALARPKLYSERLNLSSDRPVAAVLLFDTSSSMEYSVGGKSRLDDAKAKSLELLGEFPEGSRVAVLDSSELGGEWQPAVSAARDRINRLQIRPVNSPVTSQLAAAYELLGKLDEEAPDSEEVPLRFIYVFSDRTQGSWNVVHADQLARLRDRIPAPGVQSVFMDVGVKEPTNVAISQVELRRATVPAHQPVVIEATLRAQGSGCDTELLCRLDGQTLLGREQVLLDADRSRVFTFRGKGLEPGLHQVELALATKDALPFSSVGYATFEVQGPRKILIVVDDPRNARVLRTALESGNAFTCDVKSTAEMRAVFPTDLTAYKAIVLLGLARPDGDLWEKLTKRFVSDGGGIAIVPGGSQMDIDAYRGTAAREIMPAEWVQAVKSPAARGALWSAATYKHPLMAPFAEWAQGEPVDFLAPGLEPGAFRYWDIRERPDGQTDVVVSYDAKQPALVERRFDPKQSVRGRVLLFTTPLDDSHITGRDAGGRDHERWNSYLQGQSFYLVLAQKTIGYLAGDAEGGKFNFLCGQTVPMPLPPEPRFSSYTLQGPGLTSAEAIISRGENQSKLTITKAAQPGNFRVFGGDAKLAGAFSMNIAPEESLLAPMPVEPIEALFGPGSVLPLDQKREMSEALKDRWSQPVELLPWLMLFVLMVLAVENLLANKFYRQETSDVAST